MQNMICLQSTLAKSRHLSVPSVKMASVQTSVFYMAYLEQKNISFVIDDLFIVLTSSSIPEPSLRTWCGRSCKGVQYPAPMDRRDWDPSASSRLKAALSKMIIKAPKKARWI